jgi:hypothetical protein
MSPGKYVESDPVDMYLRHCLNHWLDQYSPPAGGKARLLRVASLKPTVRRKYTALAPALMQLMHAFRRAFIALFRITLQPVMNSFPTARRFSSSRSYDLSQRLARNAALQSLQTGTEAFYLIS